MDHRLNIWLASSTWVLLHVFPLQFWLLTHASFPTTCLKLHDAIRSTHLVHGDTQFIQRCRSDDSIQFEQYSFSNIWITFRHSSRFRVSAQNVAPCHEQLIAIHKINAIQLEKISTEQCLYLNRIYILATPASRFHYRRQRRTSSLCVLMS